MTHDIAGAGDEDRSEDVARSELDLAAAEASYEAALETVDSATRQSLIDFLR